MSMNNDLGVKGKCNPRRQSKAPAFTVLELIITLSLLAILALIAIPNFQRISANGNLRTAARDLVADFNSIRERAMAENTQFALTFDKDNNIYAVAPASGLPNGGKSPASIAGDIYINNVAFGSGKTATFYTRGTLSQAGNVVLKNRRGSTATITCNISGRTYVKFEMQ
jgi:prepilin-type N-terminal cleavage/methylation domain-containing protein